MSGNKKEAYYTLKTFTKTLQHSQQSSKTVVEASWRKAQLFHTGGLSTAVAYRVQQRTHPDTSLLLSNQTPTQEAESLSVLREEVEEAVRSLKAGKSAGVDNITSDLLKNGGKATTTVLTPICQKIWGTKEWPKECTQRSSYLYHRKAASSYVRTFVSPA